MKKIMLLIVLVSAYSCLLGQIQGFDNYPRPNEGEIRGGLGMNWIDGELFYSFHFMPEISFMNFGAGIDLRLDINSKGELRKENYNELSDYLSIIRYLRYGYKGEPVYGRIGAIDNYSLGNGSIMYRYNNSPGFDVKQTGLVADIDFGNFGFESIYGSFAKAGIFGLRAYVRPLQFTQLANVPIIGRLETGVTYAADFNERAGVVTAFYNGVNNDLVVTDDRGSLNIVGFDIGLPVLATSMLGIRLYADYVNIINFGSGVTSGVRFNFGGLGLVTAEARLERRFNGDNYIPSYFNGLYEIERFNATTGIGVVADSKIRNLALATSGDNGYYGELGVNVLRLFDIRGSYQRLDKTPESGILFLGTDISPEDAPFVLRAGYYKTNVGGENELFTLDERSYLFTEAGYKPVPYLLISMIYSWTFTPVRDQNENIISYEPLKRIEPRVTFIFPFEFNR
jgi:hypothetical protein